VIPEVPGFLATWLPASVAVFGLMTVLWLISLVRDDVSIVDVVWGPAYLVAVGVAWMVGTPGGWALPTLGLVGIWAVRLGVHLAPRALESEDRRYAEMRDSAGSRFRYTSLVKVFWLQAALVALFSSPLVATVLVDGTPGPAAIVAAVVAMGGLVFEAVADAQLSAFRNDPDSEGRVLKTGLWRYSRHPNYFGEAVVWWGFGGWTALALESPLPLLVSALMTGLLVRVSGIPLLEPHLESTRPGYAEYARRTSAFVPLPPSEGDTDDG